MTKIRKPRKSVEKPAPLPDEQRCCKKSTQWHCSKARFGTTRFCEKHRDCVLKEMEGPKKRGRKPGSLRPTAVVVIHHPSRCRRIDFKSLHIHAWFFFRLCQKDGI